MAQGTASREIVRRRARRCCDAYAVCLDAGEMLVVAKNLNRRQRLTVQVRTDGTAAQVDQLTRIRPAVDDYFVEDVVRAVGLVRVRVFHFFAYQLFHQVLFIKPRVEIFKIRGYRILTLVVSPVTSHPHLVGGRLQKLGTTG